MSTPSFDQQTFMANFVGAEDLARKVIKSFLVTLPDLISSVETAIQSKSASELEFSAHTLKGVASNFYAEPSRILALKLEQMGHAQAMIGADKIFIELRAELERLSSDLSVLVDKRKTA